MASRRPVARWDGPGAGARVRSPSFTAAALLALALLAGCSSGGDTPPPATGTAAQARLPDDLMRDNIRAYWRSAGVDRDLYVAVRDGRVLLTGTARTEDVRATAVAQAWRVDGVKEVINEIQIGEGGGISDSATDTWITTQLRAKLMTDPEITSGNFTIETVNQTVYLIGKARSQVELDLVLNYARGIARVRRVVNHVRV